jgi:hypothetical protein
MKHSAFMPGPFSATPTPQAPRSKLTTCILPCYTMQQNHIMDRSWTDCPDCMALASQLGYPPRSPLPSIVVVAGAVTENRDDAVNLTSESSSLTWLLYVPWIPVYQSLCTVRTILCTYSWLKPQVGSLKA